MSGLQEILLIVLVIAVILFLPRITGRGTGKASGKSLPSLSGRLRLGVVASIIWLLVWTTYFTPWNGSMLAFALVGLCPVILGWGALWILAGFDNKPNT